MAIKTNVNYFSFVVPITRSSSTQEREPVLRVKAILSTDSLDLSGYKVYWANDIFIRRERQWILVSQNGKTWMFSLYDPVSGFPDSQLAALVQMIMEALNSGDVKRARLLGSRLRTYLRLCNFAKAACLLVVFVAGILGVFWIRILISSLIAGGFIALFCAFIPRTYLHTLLKLNSTRQL